MERTKGGYRPPHMRTQSSSEPQLSQQSRPGSSDSSRGRGQGSRSRYNDRSSSDMNSSSDDLEKRRRRFEGMKKETGYGFLSRGEDNRLQRDPVARRTFFQEILKEFADLYSTSDSDNLEKLLGVLSIDDVPTVDDEKEKLANVLMSLRKLREALLNSTPDDFTKQVFLFSIRISTRVGHYQTYVPSINFLLKNSTILDKSELREVASLYALHLAHFNKEPTKALEVSLEHCPEDIHLHLVLTSFRNLEYTVWLDSLHNEKDTPRHRLMEFGESVMVEHAIKCIQKSYFQLPLSYVSGLFGMGIETLQKTYQCPWRLQDKNVVIRERP